MSAKKKKVAIIIGTRPEIIKMSPIIRFCERKSVPMLFIHTGQHYTYSMDRIFFQELKLPEPTRHLDIGSHSHGKQTGLLLTGLEEALQEEKPGIVLVQGDTNTVLAGGLAASKLSIPVGHVEAGLRSYDRTMPEEINRVLVDHLSSFLFVPTENAKRLLLKEGISEDNIFITGNTIVDAVNENKRLSMGKSGVLEQFGLKKGEYFLVTLHRQENVDNCERLKNILKGLTLVYEEYSIPILYPIHPRTKKRIFQFQLSVPKGVIQCEPLGYLEFLRLFNDARLVLTDSGGIQEEACIIRIPCVTLRENTERPETIDVGGNVLADIHPRTILRSVRLMTERKVDWSNPFGDGRSGERIMNIVMENLTKDTVENDFDSVSIQVQFAG